MLNKIKLGPKLIMGFLIVAAIAGIIGWFGISNMKAINDASTKLYERAAMPISQLLKITESFQRIRINIRDLEMAENETDKKNISDLINELLTVINDHANEYEKTIVTDEGRKMFNDFLETSKEYRIHLDEIIALVKEGKHEEVGLIIDGAGKEAAFAEQKAIEVLVEYKLNMAKQIEGDNTKLASRSTFIMLLIICAGLILAVILGLALTFSISGPIKLITDGSNRLALGDIELKGIDQDKFQKIIKRGDELGSIGNAFAKLIDYFKNKVGIANDIAKGNIDINVTIASNDDTLGIAFNETVSSLNEVLGQVNASIEQVNTGALQVSAASQQLSQGATEQASSLEEITSSVTEINSQSKQNTDGAMKASNMANQAMEGASIGNKQMQDLVLAMQDISKSAESISKISKAIDDIAFQINLLALNANVEAARAGKYGKGFAVVAEEVRNLAARSAESVKETTALIEEATKNINKGNKFVESTALKIEEIVGIASKVKEIADDVSLSSKEQTQGLDQVNIGLGQIDQVTQSNTASAEECASAAEELASQAEILKSLIEKFKLAGIDYSKKTEDTTHKSIKEQIKIEHVKQQVKTEPHVNITKKIDTKRVINIDDKDFGKF